MKIFKSPKSHTCERCDINSTRTFFEGSGFICSSCMTDAEKKALEYSDVYSEYKKRDL